MSNREMNYNLKAVIRETGLNPETLRAWERRYGLPSPERTPGGHRLYSSRDIQMLKWLIARQREGLSISRAVDLWKSLEERGEDPLQNAGLRQASPAHEETNLGDFRQTWIKACLDYAEIEGEQIIAQAFAISPPETVCIEILQKGLAEIGELWYTGQASVQQEHFSSALAMRRLHALISATPPPVRSGRILAACPPGEEHEFGLLLATLLLRRHGWEVIYLGANVPLLRLENTIQSSNPLLCVSLAETLPAAASLAEMGAFLNKQGVPLAYGGGVFNDTPALIERIPGYFIGSEISATPAAIERIFIQPAPYPQSLAVSEEYRQALSRYLEVWPLIEAEVSEQMRSADISAEHLALANLSFHDHLIAALSLGDVQLLNVSIQWVEGLVSNYGISSEVIRHYLRTFRQAIDQHMQTDGVIISNWLGDHVEINA